MRVLLGSVRCRRRWRNQIHSAANADWTSLALLAGGQRSQIGHRNFGMLSERNVPRLGHRVSELVGVSAARAKRIKK